ncbi:hypothetical protein GLP14_07980 [Photobacterium carnosum]|uniref:hypothetical protein n=1 Tax=Photobacterium carnosum TaxID=2023717 RepID=UPI001E2D7D0C|nr:hypothetical protein [Photobacterium carnosum]MCD9522777.1 hypothetical protein [Photobacterium carnosum]
MNEYKFNRSKLKNRKSGISAFIRLKNGADTIGYVLDSHINIFDEIVILLNGCTDLSFDVCNIYVEKYPGKIKLYHYEPEVYPFGGQKHKDEPEDSVHSFVNFSNYALQLTEYEYVMKLDDDHYCPVIYQSKDHFLNELKPDKVNMFSGINLVWDEVGNVVISKEYPLAGNGDHFIIKVDENTFFKKNDTCEYFDYNNKKINYIGLRYFHLKFLRKNFGFSNVINTTEGKIISDEVKKMKTISFSDFVNLCESFRISGNKRYFDDTLISRVKERLSEFRLILAVASALGSFKSRRAMRLSRDFQSINKLDTPELLRELFSELKSK